MSQAQLYISKRCPYCRQVIMVLQQRQDLKGHIQIVTIDDNPFPKEIKAVPAMVVGNELWSANDIFEFLSQKGDPQQGQQGSQQGQQGSQQGQQGSQQQQQGQQQQGQQQQQQLQGSQQQQGQQQPNQEQELEGYCENGMCGLSFSSLDGNESSLTTKYSLLDETPGSVPSGNDGYTKKNDRANKFDSEYERMMEERGKVGANGVGRK